MIEPTEEDLCLALKFIKPGSSPAVQAEAIIAEADVLRLAREFAKMREERDVAISRAEKAESELEQFGKVAKILVASLASEIDNHQCAMQKAREALDSLKKGGG